MSLVTMGPGLAVFSSIRLDLVVMLLSPGDNFCNLGDGKTVESMSTLLSDFCSLAGDCRGSRVLLRGLPLLLLININEIQVNN